jgi:hypothetical protein
MADENYLKLINISRWNIFVVRLLFFFTLIIFLLSPLKRIILDITYEFSLSPLEDFKNRKEIYGYKKSIGYHFINKIINKYYTDNPYESPIFLVKPWENGVHVLLDGYRAEDFRVKKGYLFKNYNNLILYEISEEKSISKKLIKILGKDKVNLHGIFIDITNTKLNAFIKFDDQKIEIDKKKVYTCKNIFEKTANLLIKEEDKKKVEKFKYCYFLEIKDKNNLNYTIKLNNQFYVEIENIDNFLLYGNYYEMGPYVVLDRYDEDYNYFYAKSLNQNDN